MRTLRTRAIGRGRRRRRASTPSPSRVIRDSRCSSSTPAVLDVGDEQPRRVRAEIDRGDAHLRGKVGGDPPDGAVHLVERRAQDGELRERDAQPLEAPLAARRSRRSRRRELLRGRLGLAGDSSSRRRSSCGVPLDVAPRSERAHRRAAREPRFPRSDADDQRRLDRPVPHRADRNRATGATIRLNAAGWSSQVARRAHNPEVAGSNPAPATGKPRGCGAFRLSGGVGRAHRPCLHASV